MAKKLNDLKYGPESSVYVSNSEWDARQCSPEDSNLAPAKDAPVPKAYPIDLHHLSQQAFAQDEAAKKRWFLTAFVAPEDQHLLDPPADTAIATAALNAIKTDLEQPAGSSSPENLKKLREKVVALFQQDKWLGVALQMVDNKALSIDMLNTLIQWQALYIQFGEKLFTLDTVPSSQSQSTIHHIVFAQLQLTLEEVQNSTWGKKVQVTMQLKRAQEGYDWKPTLENFSTAIIAKYFDIAPEKSDVISAEVPSTLLQEHRLLHSENPPRAIIPLYSFGLLAFEDFCAATFLGGRPMQAFLPNAKGNLYWAHEQYYGESLIVQHDFVHACSPGYVNKPHFRQEMKMLAIIANAMVRIRKIELANLIIDTSKLFDFESMIESRLKRTENEFREDRINMLQAVYNEFALCTGINLKFSCKVAESNANLFVLEAMHTDPALSFKVDLSDSEQGYLNDFMKAFEEISTLATMKIQWQQQQQQQQLDTHRMNPLSLVNNNNNNNNSNDSVNNEQPKPGCFISYLPYGPNKKPQSQASSPPSFKMSS